MGRNLRGDMRCGRRGCRCAALATWRGAPAQLGGREAGSSCQHCHPSTLRWAAGEPWDAHVGNTQQHLFTTAVAVYLALLFSSSTTGACSFISATSAAVLPSAFLMPTSAPLREAEQQQQQQQQQQHRQQLFTSS